MRKRKILGTIVGIFFLCTSFIVPPLQAQVKEVRIGVLYPMTGPLAKTGVDLRRNVMTLEEVINNKHPDWVMELAATEGLPNLGGAKVKFIIADHALSPEKGIAEAERLVTIEKCVALTGTFASGVAAAVQTVTERMQIPFLGADTSSAKLTERGLEWFFRTWVNDYDLTRAFYDAIRDLFEPMAGRKLGKLALMCEDSLWGQDSARVAKILAKERGYELVADISFRMGATSLATEVQRLKAARPDWIITNYLLPDAILFVKTCEELNYKTLEMAHGGVDEIEFKRLMAEKAEGVCNRMPMNADLVGLKPDYKRYEELYRKISGLPPGTPINSSFAAILSGYYTLVYAINKAGSTDPQKIRDTLETIMVPDKNILAPTKGGGWHFDKNHDNAGRVILVAQMQGKSFRTIYPSGFATAKPFYPSLKR